MTDRVTPPVRQKPAGSVRVLDVVLGIGAMVLLIPALPIIVIVWIVYKLGSFGDDRDEEREA